MSQFSKRFNINATLSLLVAVLCWSSVPLFMKSFTVEMDAWTMNGSRYGFAALLWLIPLIVFLIRKEITTKVLLLALIPTSINIITQTFLAWTVYFMDPGLIMFLGRISMLFSLLLSFSMFPDERYLARSKFFWVGVFLLILGFIGMNVGGEVLQSKHTWIGVVIVLFQAMTLALYGALVRYTMRGVKPWHAFSVICVYTAIGLFIMMLIFGDPSALCEMTTRRLFDLGLSAVIGIALAHVFFYHSLEHLGVSISYGCLLIAPFLTSIGSYYLFDERFTPVQWMFGVVLLGGSLALLLAQRGAKSKEE